MLRQIIFIALLASCLASEKSSSDILHPDIIGGSAAAIDQFPYMVSLQVNLLGIFRSHLCGGSIISPQWALTAAHCTVGHRASSLVIRAGSAREASGGSVHNVAQKIEHPNYNVGARFNHDIGLLRVSSPFSYSNAIQPVRLPALNAAVASGTYGVVTGWGATSQGGRGSASLLQVNVPIMSNAECRQFYAASRITDGMICAGYEAGGKDSCQGDSGGPLAASGQLVGIVSWGSGCAQPRAPGVYARVAYYRDWIAANSGV